MIKIIFVKSIMNYLINIAKNVMRIYVFYVRMSIIINGIIDFVKIIPNKDELIKEMEELQLKIDKFKDKIEIIKKILNRIINMMEIYYKINNNIVNNYNINKRNYIKLMNLNNIKNNNENLMKELNKIINNDNMDELIKFSFE